MLLNALLKSAPDVFPGACLKVTAASRNLLAATAEARISCWAPSCPGIVHIQMSQWHEGLWKGRKGQIKPSIEEPLTKKKLAGCVTGIFRAPLQEAGIAGGAGTNPWRQAAPRPLARWRPKEGGPEAMLTACAPHVRATWVAQGLALGPPALFPKWKARRKAQMAPSHPLPSRKRGEVGSL